MQPKTVSLIDENGIFIGAGAWWPSPLEPGVFLRTPGSVGATPPELPPGKFARWNEASGWVFEDIPPEPEPEPEPEPDAPPEPTPEQRLSAVRNAIKAERDRRMETGGYQVSNYWYHSDLHSRTQQLALVLTGDNLPEGIKWRTMNGDFVDMTPVLAGQILAAAVLNESAIFSAAEAHLSALDDILVPADYDFSLGWPLTFNEYQASRP
jgi:hypothetical protein